MRVSFLACFALSSTVYDPLPGPCLGNGAALSGLGVLTSVNSTVLHSCAHRPTQRKQSLTETTFPYDYKLCQADY